MPCGASAPHGNAGLVGADSRRPLDAAVVEGVELAAVHHERLAIEQSVIVQAVQEAQALAPLVGRERRRDDAVVDYHAVRIGRIAEAVVVDEGVHHERAGPAAPVVDQPRVGNLVVRIAVAVGVLVTERLQHGAQLVGGGGHLQTEPFQPLDVDPQFLRQRGVVGHRPLGQRIDVAVGCGELVRHQRILGEHALDFYGVLVDQPFQRRQEALRAVQELLFGGDVGVDDHVRQGPIPAASTRLIFCPASDPVTTSHSMCRLVCSSIQVTAWLVVMSWMRASTLASAVTVINWSLIG